MTKPSWLPAAVLALLLTACTGAPAPSTSAPSVPASASASVEPPAAPDPAIAPGTTGTASVDDRDFELHVPTGYDVHQPTALLVLLHGYSSNADQVASMFGIIPAADSRGFLVALPNGTEDGAGRRFWNASSACCNFNRSEVDDSTYLSHVIDTVSRAYAVDPARVYVAGHSNGGFMAHRMACEHADQVAAIASLAGVVDIDPTSCAPRRPVSVLQLHGTADETIAFGGGKILNRLYPSAEQTVELWEKLDRCPTDGTAGTPEDFVRSIPGDETTVTTWSDCIDGTEVALARIDKGTHIPVLQPAFAGLLLDWLDAHSR